MQKPGFDINFVTVMKKLFAITIALLYLAFSCGLVVNMHYCMGELAEISYHSTPKSDDCGYCGMEDADCCHDDLKVFKPDDSHKSSLAVKFEIPVFSGLISGTYTYNAGREHIDDDLLAYLEDPPLYGSPSRNILHAVFRI